MKEYREFQFGWLTVIITLPIGMLLAYLFINEIGERPLTTNSFLIVNGILMLIIVLFYGMTTIVDNDKIRISFGFGLIRKTIKMSTIKTIGHAKNPWYYGWGIRLIPNGWLYNISGSDSIEIKFTDKQSVIRIGTKDSEILKNEINKRMTNK